jgi:hypothetical protein
LAVSKKYFNKAGNKPRLKLQRKELTQETAVTALRPNRNHHLPLVLVIIVQFDSKKKNEIGNI